jgi:hypothetical protein
MLVLSVTRPWSNASRMWGGPPPPGCLRSPSPCCWCDGYRARSLRQFYYFKLINNCIISRPTVRRKIDNMAQAPGQAQSEISSDGEDEAMVVLEDYVDSEDDVSGTISPSVETSSQVNVDIEVGQSKINLGPVFYQCTVGPPESLVSAHL